MKKVVIAMLVGFLAVAAHAQNKFDVMIMSEYKKADKPRVTNETSRTAGNAVDRAAAIANQNAKVLIDLNALQKEHANDQYGALLKGIVSKYKELVSGKLYEAAFEITVGEVLANLRALKELDEEGSQIAERVESLLKTAKYQYKHDHYIFTRSSDWINWEKAQQVHWEVKGWHSVG